MIPFLLHALLLNVICADGNSAVRIRADFKRPVRTVAVSPSGSVVAVGLGKPHIAINHERSQQLVQTERPLVELWNITSGLRTKMILGPVSNVNCVRFSPDGKTIVAACNSGCYLWNTNGSKLRAYLPALWKPESIAFVPRGNVLFVGCRKSDKYEILGGVPATLQLWDMRHVDRFAMPGAAKKWLIKKLGAKSANSVVSARTEDIFDVAISSDGRFLATAGSSFSGVEITMKGTRYPGTINMTEISTGKNVFTIRQEDGYFECVAFSPDGKLLASGTAHKNLVAKNVPHVNSDSDVSLWSAVTGKKRGKLAGHGGPIYSVAFSLTGRILASASSDSTVRLWDVRTGRQLLILRGHKGPVRSVVFTSKGGLLASGSEDGTVILWAVEELLANRPCGGSER